MSSYEAALDPHNTTTGYVMPSGHGFFADPFSGNVDLGQFVGEFLPNFNSEDYFHPQSDSADVMSGYPQPGSAEFQTVHFLTDLGMPNS